MGQGFDIRALGAHSHQLARGPRVRLRLAQIRDARAIGALIESQGSELGGLELARLLQSHPRERIVICASALLEGAETIVGFGSIEVGAEDPDLVVVDQELTDGLAELIEDALRHRSAAISGRLAA